MVCDGESESEARSSMQDSLFGAAKHKFVDDTNRAKILVSVDETSKRY